MREADQIIVTDTGSTDGTTQRLRDKGVVVYEEVVRPWRSDRTRSLSLFHVSENTDICICADLDEVLSPGWRVALEKVWWPDTARVKYPYSWNHHADSSPDLQLYYTKIHSRQEFFWNYPVHEYLVYTGPMPEHIVFVENMVLNHYPDPIKSRGSYLPLLETAVEENPTNTRMLYYLGREYMYKEQWQGCIDIMKRYLVLSRWEEERSAAMRWSVYSWNTLGKPREAARWYLRAVAEVPQMRDPYVEFAQLAYQQKNWPLVCCLTRQASSILEKSENFANVGYAWDHTPEDLCSIACWNLRLMGGALEHARRVVELNPDNERLKKNLQLISTAMEKAPPD